MADDADMRAVLREHGHEPSARGRLSPRWVAEYEKITSGQAPADDDSGESWDGPDDSADIITGIIPPDIGDISEDTEPAPVAAERKPRRVKAKPSNSGWDRLLGRKPGAKPRTRAKAKVPRVPVDHFISGLWQRAGRIIAPLSGAAARAFILEAPVAGVIFEGAVKGTVIDRGLQPVVRAEQRAERAVALTPPLIVLAIERAQGLPEPRRQVQLAVLFTMLEEALTLQIRFAGEHMVEIEERMAADEDIRRQVQHQIALIFPQAEVQADANGQPQTEFNFAATET